MSSHVKAKTFSDIFPQIFAYHSCNLLERKKEKKERKKKTHQQVLEYFSQPTNTARYRFQK